MIKLNITQAKAIAHRISLDAQKAYNTKREKFTNEFMKSREYETMRKYVTEVIDATFIVCENDDSVEKLFINFWGTYVYFNEDSDFENCVKQAMDSYVHACVNKKLPYPYIREDKLAQDIIFESIRCDDIDKLVKKFVDKYNG